MKWLTNFLTSSIGRKVIMSLTGLFLIAFLKVHLIGNLQLLVNDGGESFNTYAKFMTTNPLIKFISWGLYLLILLHAVVGIMIYLKNRKAKGVKYTGKQSADVTWASKNMALLGTLILAFILIHMGDFWWKMHNGVNVNLYEKVSTTFSNPIFVGFYVLAMIVLALHLWHGFKSAFQTLGLNHSKYNPIISFIGKAYSIIVPLAYAIIPIYFYFNR
ncbi:MAG: succinate dehydrogenase cytochrome b subunit [Saprospiraceae bacterium]